MVKKLGSMLSVPGSWHLLSDLVSSRNLASIFLTIPTSVFHLAGLRGHDRSDGVEVVLGGVRGERGPRAAAGGPQDGAQEEEGRTQDQDQAAQKGSQDGQRRQQGAARLQVWKFRLCIDLWQSSDMFDYFSPNAVLR